MMGNTYFRCLWSNSNLRSSVGRVPSFPMKQHVAAVKQPMSSDVFIAFSIYNLRVHCSVNQHHINVCGYTGTNAVITPLVLVTCTVMELNPPDSSTSC